MSDFKEPAKTHSEFSLIVNMIHRIRRILMSGSEVNVGTNHPQMVYVDHYARYTGYDQYFDEQNTTSTMRFPRTVLEQCLPDIANLYSYVKLGAGVQPHSPSKFINVIAHVDTWSDRHVRFVTNTSGINSHVAFARRHIVTGYMSHFVKVAPPSLESRSAKRVLYPHVPPSWYAPDAPLPREVEDYLLVLANQSLTDLEYLRAHNQRCSLITLTAIKWNIFGVFNYSIRYRPKWAGCNTLRDRICRAYDPKVDGPHTLFGQVIPYGSEDVLVNIHEVANSLHIIADDLHARLNELRDFFQPLSRKNW